MTNSCEARKNQKESMFSTGNAMSRAPICSGMRKFPKVPMSTGVIAKKIMISPCMVKMLWYWAGPMTPSVERRKSEPSTGTLRYGKAHCHRMSIASVPPTSRKMSPAHRNCCAITLWSSEKTYLRMNEVGAGWIACSSGRSR